jgi:AcrR family transcriptional regulator
MRTRERLLVASRQLLDSRGFGAVTLEDVGGAAGVSRQTVYLHFGSRAGLLAALAQSIDEAIAPLDLYKRLAGAPTAAAALEVGLEIHLHFERHVHVYARALQALRGDDSAADAAWEDRMASRKAGLAGIVDRMVEEGRLADGWTRREAIDFMVALTSVDMYEALVIQARWAPETYKSHLMKAICGSILLSRRPGHGAKKLSGAASRLRS